MEIIIILVCFIFVIYYLFRPTSKKEKDQFNDKIIGVGVLIYSTACFIESLTLPLSKPITLTFTSSPLTTSVTLATLLSASSEI